MACGSNEPPTEVDAAAAEEEVLASLDAELNLAEYQGDPVFSIPEGRCTVFEVETDPAEIKLRPPEGFPEEKVRSPEGDIAVEVNIFIGSDTDPDLLREA